MIFLIHKKVPHPCKHWDRGHMRYRDLISNTKLIIEPNELLNGSCVYSERVHTILTARGEVGL